jgi:hypothetical protein
VGVLFVVQEEGRVWVVLELFPRKGSRCWVLGAGRCVVARLKGKGWLGLGLGVEDIRNVLQKKCSRDVQYSTLGFT